jgi:hypothetical protein
MTSTVQPRLNLLQQKIAKPETPETTLKEFQSACKYMLIGTSEIIKFDDGVPLSTFRKYNIAWIVRSILKAYVCLDIDAPESTADLWGSSTRPDFGMIKAKLVRYSSNMYAVSMAYPDTCLESNLDYDLRQYLMFLHAYCEALDSDLMKICDTI